MGEPQSKALTHALRQVISSVRWNGYRRTGRGGIYSDGWAENVPLPLFELEVEELLTDADGPTPCIPFLPREPAGRYVEIEDWLPVRPPEVSFSSKAICLLSCYGSAIRFHQYVDKPAHRVPTIEGKRHV